VRAVRYRIAPRSLRNPPVMRYLTSEVGFADLTVYYVVPMLRPVVIMASSEEPVFGNDVIGGLVFTQEKER
jgi:hypothetical protein